MNWASHKRLSYGQRYIFRPWLVPSSGIADDLISPYSSMLPCLLCCPLSDPPLSCLSYHARFGRPLLLFPGMSTSSILLTMCPSVSSSSLDSFFCNFLGRLRYSCCPSNVFISDLVTPHISIRISFSLVWPKICFTHST